MVCLWDWETLLLFVLLISCFLNVFSDILWLFLYNFVNYWKVIVNFVPQVFNFESVIVLLNRFVKVKFFNRSINDRLTNLLLWLSHLLLLSDAFMWFGYWLVKHLGFDLSNLYFFLYFFRLLNLDLLVLITQLDCILNVLLNTKCSLRKLIEYILRNHKQLLLKSCIEI